MELNREQIIKALECHQKNEKKNTCEYCTNCPASEYDLCEGVTTDDCVDEMFTATILLIKELTEENERLRAERDTRDIAIKDLYSRNKELQKANEDLGKHCTDLTTELIQYTESKADTVKKMQHKIWLEYSDCTPEETISVGSLREQLDQIAEEIIKGETK